MVSVMGQEIELGMPEMNTMVKYLGHVTMDFSALTMYEVHGIQNVVITEMNNKENSFLNQVKSSRKVVNKMKKTVQEAEHKS